MFFHKIKKTLPRLPGFGYSLYYSDTRGGGSSEITSKLLISEKYDISGKPDMVYRKRSKYIPVELKSGKINDAMHPHEGDMFQLVAYFLIIEDVFGKRPKQGRLIYSDYMFIIKNTRKLRKRLSGVLIDMREMLETGENDMKMNFAKCRGCVYREEICELHNT